jgi:A/G-specific adenine glycosylase
MATKIPMRFFFFRGRVWWAWSPEVTTPVGVVRETRVRTTMPGPMIGEVKTFGRDLLAWYDRHRRDLPWRVRTGSARNSAPDPYHVLLSEAMLQQTQVATVVPYFQRFIERFPALSDLAGADLQDVLRLWQGLGYYSRARNLHACAGRVVAEHGGRVPGTVEELLKLPGVGRYTAGAIASLAYGTRAPILDGNVMRVLCRIDQIESDPRSRETQAVLWWRAEEILPDRRVGDFNSALMELGATVCTPKNPQCLLCPVRSHCEAAAAGVQDRIPLPKKAKPTPLNRRYVLCVGQAGRYLIEQRPARGRWAGMWQFKTTEANGRAPSAGRLKAWLGFAVSKPVRLGVVRHALTHRRYEFEAYRAEAPGEPAAAGRVWVTLGELDAYPLSKPQLSIAKLLAASLE